MGYASVVVDIPTRALDAPFEYAVPSHMDVAVGATVLVTFSRRMAVGYVVERYDVSRSGCAPDKILPVEQILAAPAFDALGAQMALWIAREYAAPPAHVLRLMVAPGQTIRVKRTVCDGDDGARSGGTHSDEAHSDESHSDGGHSDEGHGNGGHDDNDKVHNKDADGRTFARWTLICERMHPKIERSLSLTEEGRTYVPPSSAHRQRAVLSALARGPRLRCDLVAELGNVSQTIKDLRNKGLIRIAEKRRVRGAVATSLSSARAPRPEELTDGQITALKAIDDAVDTAAGDVVLIDGVTGSGKTEVYLLAIEHVCNRGKRALVLVPEIALTAQTIGRFQDRFAHAVAVLHSRLSAGERFDQWDRVRSGEAQVVVGARSALFAPIQNLGLIIIDEEHEFSYKQDQAPRYHAREVAAHLAQQRGAALVLGSATPSFESLYHCEHKTWRGASWKRVVMTERPLQTTLPSVHIVNMLDETATGNTSIFSRCLAKSLVSCMTRGEKAVLLNNRRGFANFLMCRDCGCVPVCPHCSTSLTYHERTHRLMCHSCGSFWPERAYPDPSTACPNCGSRYLARFGVGTQRVEDELAILFEDVAARVIRMDADTTSKKGAHQQLLEEFDAPGAAVLLGTQMVAKGLDFPDVTLVGVINADTSLKMPDFRAAERTYDLLEQVAGRTGRGQRKGEIIVQTRWADAAAIRALACRDRSEFVQCELADRKAAGYPPFVRLSNVVFTSASEDEARRGAIKLAEIVREKVEELGDGWSVLGPVDCLKAKIKNRYRWHILLKSPPESEPALLLSACVASLGTHKGTTIVIDVDAYDLM